ncbi:MAG: mitochondrial fission ELM1 family protein [Candidatus Omnitrophica bacterium]|nr:mitochondrial fission ELM1 family protein [Candidatus Omnitrophota bacterium]
MIDWLLCWVVKSLGWVLRRIPPQAAIAVGMTLGHAACWCQPTRARIGDVNLKAAFGDRLSPAKRRRIIVRMFQHLGAGVVEMLRLPAMDEAYMKRFLHIDGQDHLDRTVQSGRPVMFMTAHFGNWELCAILVSFLGYPIVALARAQEKFPRLYRLLVSYRESKGCRIVHKGSAMRQLIRALRRHEPVGIVGDQASRQGVAVNFFGRPALFATGPYELAYRTGAIILPAFLYRVRGPSNHLVFEPPFECPPDVSSEEAVRVGVERFAALLAAHIERDPAQWLWVHNRWKYTTARHVLVLSDGKQGHVKQSLAVVQILKTLHADDRGGTIRAAEEVSAVAGLPTVRDQVVEVRYRHRLARLLTLLWAWGVPRGMGGITCLRWTLTPACFNQLVNVYADVVVSCGASTAPVNVLLATENRAKSVVVMNPTPLPLRRFSLAIVPTHDRIASRPHVVHVPGALTTITDEELVLAGERLTHHPQCRGHSLNGRQPVISVLLGGDTAEYEMTTAFVEAVIHQVLEACEAVGGCCLVTSSRRTPADVERLLQERLARHPRCALLLLAGRDQLNGTIEGMLGLARVVVVTGESVSMVTEACASGRHVLVVEPPRRQAGWGRLTKPQRYVRQLAESGHAKLLFLREINRTLQRLVAQPLPSQRLDASAPLHEAVARLL